MLDTVQYILGALSGALVGFSLGLVGGGGSILAVPLMVYLVGVRSPHVAIGTSALPVAANAALGLANHARRPRALALRLDVCSCRRRRCFRRIDRGQGIRRPTAAVPLRDRYDRRWRLMLRRRRMLGIADAQCDRNNAPKVLGYGLGTGAFSGFFGIGGGFPDRSWPDRLDRHGHDQRCRHEPGRSHRFRAHDGAQLRLSGLVDWMLAAVFIAGGLAGSLAGTGGEAAVGCGPPRAFSRR